MRENLSGHSFWIQVVVSAFLVLLVSWVSIWGYPNFNEQIFLALNTIGGRGGWFWQNLTVLGEGLVAFVLLASFSRRDGHFIWALLFAALIAGLSSQLMKHWMEMPRPAAVLEPGSFNLIGAELRARAFPSGHATTALVAASMASWRFPQVRLTIYTLFICVALSRVIVGAHWPFDVLAGGCLGYLSGWCARCISTRYLMFRAEWTAIVAWLLVSILALWLFIFDLDYPAARVLALGIGSLGVVTAILNLRLLLVK